MFVAASKAWTAAAVCVGVAAGVVLVWRGVGHWPRPEATALMQPPPPQVPAASPATAPPKASASPSSGIAPAPQFDVARVEPSGATVIAGRASPGAEVALFDGDVRLASERADPNGQFVILPSALSPGDHILTLRAGAVASAQSVAISVPVGPGGPTLAALAEPGAPTRLLTGGPAPGATGIVAVEVGETGALLASGAAPAGSPVRVYLDQSFLGAAVAGGDGRWRLSVDRKVEPGRYEVRADILSAGGATVAQRASVAFDYAQPAVVAGSAALQPLKVATGDTLWRISRRMFGTGARYTQIYKANAGQIRDPNRIYPGQVFSAPIRGG